jgi:hypothetical protein
VSTRCDSTLLSTPVSGCRSEIHTGRHNWQIVAFAEPAHVSYRLQSTMQSAGVRDKYWPLVLPNDENPNAVSHLPPCRSANMLTKGQRKAGSTNAIYVKPASVDRHWNMFLRCIVKEPSKDDSIVPCAMVTQNAQSNRGELSNPNIADQADAVVLRCGSF